MNNNKLLAVDLFSGAGGLSLGFMQTGQVQIVAAVENNVAAQKTYKRNHRGVKLFGDITRLDYNEIVNECKKMGSNHVNLVFGGPPCQGFSNANRQKTELISTNNQLVKEYVKAIEKLKPDAFVMENVKALQSSKHKFFYSINDRNEIIDKLNLELSNERITLGKVNSLTNELISFIKNAINQKRNLLNYIILDDNLLSKLRQLGRKEKDFEKYLDETQKALNKLSIEWGGLHNQYWSNSYKEKWVLLGQEIQKQSKSDISLHIVHNTLNEIIETQRILMKMNEVVINNIEIIDVVQENKNVCIVVKTYGVLDFLFTKFKNLGYIINEDSLILNAAHFGAPQLRERLFLIGVKSKYVDHKQVELPKPIINDTNMFYTVRDAIEDLEELKPSTQVDEDKPIIKLLPKSYNSLLRYLNGNINTLRNHVMTKTTQVALERFKMLKQGQNFHHLDEVYKHTYTDPTRTQNTVYLRLNYNAPSMTVLNVRKSMWVHPEKARAISIREAARLQTFPDDFIFEGPKDSQYQQIGNAVPPLLGRAVAEQVLIYLGKQISEPLASIITPFKPEEIVCENKEPLLID